MTRKIRITKIKEKGAPMQDPQLLQKIPYSYYEPTSRVEENVNCSLCKEHDKSFISG
jgi:hypothetical protein